LLHASHHRLLLHRHPLQSDSVHYDDLLLDHLVRSP
jgi:hypothetical protein